MAGTLDVVAVLVFVAIGRTSHDHGISVSGMVSTSLAVPGRSGGGLGTGSRLAPPARTGPDGGDRLALVRGRGDGVRVVAGQGTAVAFVAVALGFLALELLGWRALAGLGNTLRAGRR